MPTAVSDWQAYLEAMAPAVGLEIRDEWKLSVASYLAMAATNAALYANLPFDDATDEAAPIFKPGGSQ